MTDRPADPMVARRVELALAELDGLSIQPCVALQFLPRLVDRQFSPVSLADIVEADPALAAKILSLAAEQTHSQTPSSGSIRRALEQLPAASVRDALLAMKTSAGFESEEPAQGPSRKDLIIHSLAVACCCTQLAGLVSPPVPADLAYTAGLLHDIGKLALQDVMPRSLSRIAAQAQSRQVCLCEVEQESLGTDHPLLGKHLAQRWQLPTPVVFAIWLHHSRTDVVARDIPQAELAHIVHAADTLARRVGLGQSGSYDAPEPVASIAESLGIAPELLEKIAAQLPEVVGKKAAALGLDTPEATSRYYDTLQTVAARLAEEQTQSQAEAHRLHLANGHLESIRDVVLASDSKPSAIEVSQEVAIRWQRFYQTGTVCLLLETPAQTAGAVDVVVVEALGNSKKLVLEAPDDWHRMPAFSSGKAGILPVGDMLDWLFEQLEAEFDRGRTMLVPLVWRQQPIGAIVFESSYPGDVRLFADSFETTARVAGLLIGAALETQRQEHLAARLVRLIQPPAAAVEQPSPGDGILAALAEMAAGIAHELNNPLAVISGRAQMLAKTEKDEAKKRSLEQIRQNVEEAATLVDDLMAYAEPDPPRRAQTSVLQVIEEAAQLASQKTGIEHVNLQSQISAGAETVWVDSGQVVSALAEILCNSLEAYTGPLGPVKISAETVPVGRVRLEIADLGCGMAEETLQKATHPFFSAKPAGRKRGMGLAYAQRLLALNGGSLSMQSKMGEGTTTTLFLPKSTDSVV